MALLQAERIKELEEATRLADQMDLLVAEVAAQGGRTAEVEAETDVVPWLPLPTPPKPPCLATRPCLAASHHLATSPYLATPFYLATPP